MASTLTNLLFHVVFSTKDRAGLIGADVRERLHAYIGGIVRNQNGRLLAIGGAADHVHLLMRLPPSIALSDMLRKVKANSSKWANEARPFGWQRGYSAFSVSESLVPMVTRYIASQVERHGRVTFQEELVTLLRKHGVEYDERYLWT